MTPQTSDDAPPPQAPALTDRLWLPVSAEAVLRSDGFVAEVDAFWPRQDPGAVDPGHALGSHGAVVVLGDSGLGKTSVLKTIRDGLRASGNEVHFVDLGSTNDELMLERRLTEKGPWQSWHAGTGHLTLLLDSFDESVLRMDVVEEVVGEQLRDAPVERLSLMIASRPGRWSARFQAVLGERWDTLAVGRLLPMSAKQVAAEAAKYGVDGDAFVARAGELGLAPLAGNPSTLRGLLAYAADHDGEPAPTRTDAYRAGIELLCTEDRDGRRRGLEAKRGAQGAADLVVAAQRIAAAMLLSGRSRVVVERDPADVLTTDELDLATLVGGVELRAGGDVPVGDALLRDTALSSVFTHDPATSRATFAARSYGEFLAAEWLSKRVSAAQAYLLLRAAHEDRVVPQLRGVAGWWGSLDADGFAHVLGTDPELLLDGDVSQRSDTEREALVDRVLQTAGDVEAGDGLRTDLGALRALDHPQVASQISDALRNHLHSADRARLAVLVAMACQTSAVVENLVDCAMDSAADMELRTRCVQAVADLAGTADPRLVALLDTAPADDPDDQLRGIALDVLWPSALTTQQVLEALTSPQNPRLIGSYAMFIRHTLPERLRTDDLLVVLRWARDNIARVLSDPFDDLGAALVHLASRNLDDPNVAGHVADLIAEICGQKEGYGAADRWPFVDGETSPTGRRAVLAALAALDPAQQPAPYELLSLANGLLSPDDLGWLLARAGEAHEADVKTVWLDWAQAVFSWDNRTHVGLVWDAIRSDESWRPLLGHLLEPESVNSPIAQRYRQRAERRRSLEAAREPRGQAPSTPEQLRAEADADEAGERWPYISELLATGPGGPYGPGKWSKPPHTSAVFWELSDDERARVVEVARSYLLLGDAADPWEAGQGEPPAWVTHTQRALALTFALNADYYEHLNDIALWQRWAAVIFDGWWLGDDNGALRRPLSLLAWDRCPTTAAEIYESRLLRGASRDGSFLEIEHEPLPWNAAVQALYLTLIGDAQLPPPVLESVIKAGLKAGSAEVRVAAERTLDDVVSDLGAGELYDRTRHAATALLSDVSPSSWGAVHRAATENPEWGAEMVRCAATLHGPSVASLTTSQLGEAWRLIRRVQPPVDDASGSVSEVTAELRVGMWRDNVLAELARRGSREAVHAIEVFAGEFADRSLRYAAADAVARYRESTWAPADPAEVLALAADPRTRVVRSDEELLDAVLGSLTRAQERLRPPEPSVDLLWDTHSKRPKSEDELSDWLAWWLRDDLGDRHAIVNREVQVAPAATGVGERNDLLVQCSAGGTGEPFSVVIEVKGAWNAELKTAADQQLAKRYLDAATRRCGIYLVFFFDREVWAKDDGRRKRCAKPKAELCQLFDEQAAELSADGTLAVRAFVMDASIRPPRPK